LSGFPALLPALEMSFENKKLSVQIASTISSTSQSIQAFMRSASLMSGSDEGMRLYVRWSLVCGMSAIRHDALDY